MKKFIKLFGFIGASMVSAAPVNAIDPATAASAAQAGVSIGRALGLLERSPDLGLAYSVETYNLLVSTNARLSAMESTLGQLLITALDRERDISIVQDAMAASNSDQIEKAFQELDLALTDMRIIAYERQSLIVRKQLVSVIASQLSNGATFPSFPSLTLYPILRMAYDEALTDPKDLNEEQSKANKAYALRLLEDLKENKGEGTPYHYLRIANGELDEILKSLPQPISKKLSQLRGNNQFNNGKISVDLKAFYAATPFTPGEDFGHGLGRDNMTPEFCGTVTLNMITTDVVPISEVKFSEPSIRANYSVPGKRPEDFCGDNRSYIVPNISGLGGKQGKNRQLARDAWNRKAEEFRSQISRFSDMLILRNTSQKMLENLDSAISVVSSYSPEQSVEHLRAEARAGFAQDVYRDFLASGDQATAEKFVEIMSNARETTNKKITDGRDRLRRLEEQAQRAGKIDQVVGALQMISKLYEFSEQLLQEDENEIPAEETNSEDTVDTASAQPAENERRWDTQDTMEVEARYLADPEAFLRGAEALSERLETTPSGDKIGHTDLKALAYADILFNGISAQPMGVLSKQSSIESEIDHWMGYVPDFIRFTVDVLKPASTASDSEMETHYKQLVGSRLLNAIAKREQDRVESENNL